MQQSWTSFPFGTVAYGPKSYTFRPDIHCWAQLVSNHQGLLVLDTTGLIGLSSIQAFRNIERTQLKYQGGKYLRSDSAHEIMTYMPESCIKKKKRKKALPTHDSAIRLSLFTHLLGDSYNFDQPLSLTYQSKLGLDLHSQVEFHLNPDGSGPKPGPTWMGVTREIINKLNQVLL